MSDSRSCGARTGVPTKTPPYAYSGAEGRAGDATGITSRHSPHPSDLTLCVGPPA